MSSSITFKPEYPIQTRGWLNVDDESLIFHASKGKDWATCKRKSLGVRHGLEWEYRVRWFYLTHPQRYLFASSWLPVEDYTLHALKEAGYAWNEMPIKFFNRDDRGTEHCKERYEDIVKPLCMDAWDTMWSEPQYMRLRNLSGWALDEKVYWELNWDEIANGMPGKSHMAYRRRWYAALRQTPLWS